MQRGVSTSQLHPQRELSHKTLLTAACSSLVMEAGKLGLGIGVSSTSPVPSPSTSPQPLSHMPASEIMPAPTPSIPKIDTRRMRRLTIKTDRPDLGPPAMGPLGQPNHMAKFKKSRRAHSIATSKADTVITKELTHAVLPSTPSSILNLPSHFSVLNMRSSLDNMRPPNNNVLRRAFSEPRFNSWEFGYTNDVFEAEYDISPAATERNPWDEEASKDTPSPITPSSDDDSSSGERKTQQDIIFRVNDSG